MSAPPDPLVGRLVGEYRVTDVLGRGGMGTVYRADDTALGVPVALKAIAPELAADDAFARRFRTEARAMARAASPHIVRVMALREMEVREAGPEGESPEDASSTDAHSTNELAAGSGVSLGTGLFIVMEYVDGGDLHARMASGPLPWPELWPLLRQTLLGLAAAHAVGVVHRDVKPRNVLLTAPHGAAGPTVKLTDFGLARFSDADATRTQAVAGTLAYMSPEQVRASPTLDHRSDLFSLGLVAYEALAGRLPFARDGGEFTVMRSIVEEPFAPPTEYAPGVPGAVSGALMRALAKDPAERYASADAMRAALAAAGDEIGATLTRVPALPRPPSTSDETRVLPPEAPAVASSTPHDRLPRPVGELATPPPRASTGRTVALGLVAATVLVAVAGGAYTLLTRQPEASPSVVLLDGAVLRSEPSARGGDATVRARLGAGDALDAVAQTADADGTRWLKVWHQDSLRWIEASGAVQLTADVPYESFRLRARASDLDALQRADDVTASAEPSSTERAAIPDPRQPERRQLDPRLPDPEPRQPEPRQPEPRQPERTPPPPPREPVAEAPTCSAGDVARQTTLAVRVQTETDPDARARLQTELAEIQRRCR